MTQKRDTENVESRLPEEEDPEVQRWMELLRTDVPPEVEARLNAALDRFVAQLPDQPTRRPRWLFMPRLNWVNAFVVLVPVVCIVSFFLLSPWEDVSRVKVLPSTVLLDPDEPGTRKSVELVVKNTGRKPIREAAVHHSCAGCSVIAGITEPIAPGESSTVSVPFDYPVHEGRFTEKLYVSAYYNGREEPFRSEVAVVGSAESTVCLMPRSITHFIPRGIESVTAFFMVQLRNDATWLDLQLGNIIVTGATESFGTGNVNLRRDLSERLILGTFHFDTSILGAGGAIGGIVEIKAKSSYKDYKLQLPFKLATQGVQLASDLITLLDRLQSTVTLELPPGISLTEARILPLDTQIPYQQEIRHISSWTTLSFLTLNREVNNLSSRLDFPTVVFRFSDGSTIQKPVVFATT